MGYSIRIMALAVAALVSSSVNAAPVTVTLTGETRSFFSGPFNVGTPVTATWTYDTAQPPDSNSSFAIFNNAARSFSLTFDGYGTFTGDNGLIRQINGSTNELQEMEIGNGKGTLSGPVIGGLEILYFFVRFAGDTFDDRSVLSSGFTTSDAFIQDLVMRFIPVGGGSQVQVELHALTRTFEFSATSVPSPGALALLGFGLLGLGCRRRNA